MSTQSCVNNDPIYLRITSLQPSSVDSKLLPIKKLLNFKTTCNISYMEPMYKGIFVKGDPLAHFSSPVLTLWFKYSLWLIQGLYETQNNVTMGDLGG